MTLWRMLLHELRFRTANSLLCAIAVALAVGSYVAAVAALQAYDANTEALLAQRITEAEARMKAVNEEMRQATLKLSFNLVILPEGQDIHEWYTEDYAKHTMPEEYVERLADSGIVTVRHFLPSLQQKIKWPEQNQTIILVGTRGEVPNMHKNRVKPLVQPVPEGTITLGHELHQRLDLKVGDDVAFMGQTFKVNKCHSERGSRDDITAWIPLAAAQKLLKKEQQINAIVALECLCVGKSGLAQVRADIAKILPNTVVFEQGSKVVARMETRMKVAKQGQASVISAREHRSELRADRENFTSLLTAGIIIACGVWIGFLTWGNVHERRDEIAILRTIGVQSRQILLLFLSKAVSLALVGAALGLIVGTVVGQHLAASFDPSATGNVAVSSGLSATVVGQALMLAGCLALMASWIPSLLASQCDPADVLRDSS